MSTWVVQPGEEDRIDKFISQHTTHSRGAVQKQIENGSVSRGDQVVTSSKERVSAGESITFTEPTPPPDFPTATATELKITYENDDFLVIDKPAGMVVHPNDFNEEGTLVHALLHHYPAIREAIYDPENPVSRLRPGIVHRLDKDTSGLMVVAKNSATLHALAAQFHAHTVAKTYRALLYGELREARMVNAPIQRRGGGDKNTMRASHDSSQGRPAVSHFTPVEVLVPYEKWPEEKATLAEVRIETGRTHQIRVHAKFIGHPVLGDHLYGNKPSIKLSEKIGVKHQLLQACRLAFTNPRTGEWLHFELPRSGF